jgi:hypothetical protein
MADPRDTAPLCRHGFPLAAEHGGRLDDGRTWTCWNGQYVERESVYFVSPSERYRDAGKLCTDLNDQPCEACVLDAILSAPGVDVTTLHHPLSNTRRIALLLSAEEGTGT